MLLKADNQNHPFHNLSELTPLEAKIEVMRLLNQLARSNTLLMVRYMGKVHQFSISHLEQPGLILHRLKQTDIADNRVPELVLS